MRKSVRWGIIGAGGIARRRTLPVMCDVANAEVIGIMDANASCLPEIANEYQIPYYYSNEDELLKNPDIDAVYIATPVCFHKEQALKALSAGKHLLLEKPIALTLEDAKELTVAADISGKKTGIGMVMRFHPGHEEMRKIIRSGGIGDIVFSRLQLTCWFPYMENNWRQSKKTGGGGALVDMGVHCIDLIRFLLGEEVTAAYGEIYNRTFPYEVDDSADCILTMSHGDRVFFDVHFNIPDDAATGRIEIYGTKGSLIADGTVGQADVGCIQLIQSDPNAGYESAQNRSNGQKTIVEYPHDNIYASQIRAFSDAILNDAKVSTSFEDALQTMRVTESLYRSGKFHEKISIEA